MEALKDKKISLENSSYELYSFDIFDTLVTRKVATPKGIFAIMQEEIIKNDIFKSLPSNIKENFFLIRCNTEQYLKAVLRLTDVNEVTLDEIYDFIAANYSLLDAEKASLLQLELQTEINNLIPITENIAKLKSLIMHGKRVVLITDMYLQSKYLKFILTNIDEIFENVPIYSSADYKQSKQNNKLYNIVSIHENVNYHKWKHFGDNNIADIKNAKKLGIKAEKYDFPKLKKYEEKILEKYENNVFFQQMLGISKISKVLYGNKNEKFELGLSLAAPMLIPYVSWVLEQSVRLNINRLYFISRDGFVLKGIADKIISNLNLDIKTEYVYGSREAWRLPSLNEDNFDIINYVFTEKWYLKSVEGLAERFAITLDELSQFLPSKYKNYKKYLTFKDVSLIQNLLENKDFMNLILSKNSERKKRLLAYIHQTFDFSDDNFALVDLQGSGVTQKNLASLINTFYQKPIKCFYSRLTPSIPTINDKYVNIYIEFPNKDYTHFIRELFCRALHGQTVDYKIVDGAAAPVIKGDAVSLKKWGYQDFIDGIFAFIETYFNYRNQNEKLPAKLDLFIEYYNYIIKTPDEEIARILGSIPFSYVGCEDDEAECAPPFTLLDVLKYPNIKQTVLKYSLLRSPKYIQSLVKLKIKLSNIINPIFIQINKKKGIAVIKIFGRSIHFENLLWGKCRCSI